MNHDTPDDCPIDLALATDGQLIRELRSRFNGMLLVTEKDHKTDHTIVSTAVWYRGSTTQALGMAEYAKFDLCSELQRSRAKEFDDE